MEHNKLSKISDNDNDAHSIKVSSVEIFEADTRVNIDSQVETAQKFKRDVPSALEEIVYYATRSMEIANSCFYALVRREKNGELKKITGASVRLAELISSCFGNIQASARVVSNDGRTITAQGICRDLQKNVAFSIEVQRSIITKDGTVYKQDLQVATANAACSIALRNAILKVIPLAVTQMAQEKIKEYILTEGNFPTVRQNAITYFEDKGVSVKSILSLFEKKSVEELTREDVVDLRGIATAIRDGDTTIELTFSIAPQGGSALGKASKALSLPIEPLGETIMEEEHIPEPTESKPDVTANDMVKKEVAQATQKPIEEEVEFGSHPTISKKETVVMSKEEKTKAVLDGVDKHEIYPNEAVQKIDEINGAENVANRFDAKVSDFLSEKDVKSKVVEKVEVENKNEQLEIKTNKEEIKKPKITIPKMVVPEKKIVAEKEAPEKKEKKEKKKKDEKPTEGFSGNTLFEIEE